MFSAAETKIPFLKETELTNSLSNQPPKTLIFSKQKKKSQIVEHCLLPMALTFVFILCNKGVGKMN